MSEEAENTLEAPEVRKPRKKLPSGPVERLFPFVLRSRILLIGRETLARSKSKLHFILITEDLSDKSRERILSDFAYYPVVRHYTSADLEAHFGVQGTKVLGFAKSPLAQSIYAELKEYRVNKAVIPVKPPPRPKPPAQEAQKPAERLRSARK